MIPKRVLAPLRPMIATALAVVVSAAAVAGDGERDHERARRAVIAGEILPLSVIIERLATTHPGQVLEAELEREHGRWVYEIRLLAADGRRRRLEVDAASGRVLDPERGRGRGRGRDRDRERSELDDRDDDRGDDRDDDRRGRDR